MVDATTYDIKVDLTDAQAKIDKFVQSLKDAQKYVDSLGSGLKNIGKFNTPIPGFGNKSGQSDSDDSPTNRDLEQRFKRDSINHFKVMKDYGKDFKLYAPQFSNTLRGIVGLSTSIMRLAAGGFVIGGAMRAMDAAANGVVQDKKSSLALGGADIGKMRAAGYAFGNLPIDVPGAIAKVSEGTWDITSKSAKALRLLGFSNKEIEGGDPSDLFSQALGREQKRIQGYSSKGITMPMEEALSGAELFGHEGVKALGATGSKFVDIGKLQAEYRDKTKDFERSQKAQDNMDDFTRKMGEAGAKVETAFTEKLALAAPTIVAYTNALADGLVELMNVGINKPHINPDGTTDYLDDETKKARGELGDSAVSLWKTISSGFDKEWDKLFGHPSDTWAPFFNDLEKDWKTFFDKLAPNSANTPALWDQPMSLEANGGGGFVLPGGGGRNRALRARGTRGSGGAGSGGGPYPDIHMPAGASRGKGAPEPGLFATNIGLIASKGYAAADAALLDTIGTGETPGGSYSNPDHDPGGLGGRYQFLKSSWRTWAKNAGVDPSNFSAENQDKAALLYAQTVIRQKTHQNWAELSKTPEGVARAIGALSPGVWNGIGNVDRDKRGHSGAVRLFLRKQQEEAAAARSAVAGGSNTAPTTTPVASKPAEHMSMNNMSHFQQDKRLALKIDNAAGANYVVSGGMLGGGSGNYG
jgi:hypothetical protein